MVGQQNSTSLGELALKVMINMNAAIINIRIFPPSNPMTANFIDASYDAFRELFQKRDSVVFAEAEKNLLFCDEPLDQKELQKPQVAAFLDLLVKFGIKSISFNQGLEKEEFRIFLETLSHKPEDLEKEGGLLKVMEQKNLPHILLNRRIYIATDKGWTPPAGGEPERKAPESADEIGPSLGDVIGTIPEIADDPVWTSRVIQAGFRNLSQKAGTVPHEELSGLMTRLINLSSTIKDPAVKQGCLRQIMGDLAEMDSPMVRTVMSQHLDSMPQEGVDDNVINGMGAEEFKKLAYKVKQEGEWLSTKRGEPEWTRFQPFYRLYENMASSDRFQQLEAVGAEAVGEREADPLKVRADRILEEEEDAFSDENLMNSLPSLVGRLLDIEENETVEALLDKVVERLSDPKADVRSVGAHAMFHTIEVFKGEKGTGTLRLISSKLINWIKRENALTDTYQEVCDHLEELTGTFIDNYLFSDAMPLLELFNHIHFGKIEKSEPIQELSGDVLNRIGAIERVDKILKEIQTNERNKRKEAREVLVTLGKPAINPLLDIILESASTPERNRALQLISEIGAPAADTIAERIEKGGEWYHLRNLALLLGRLGNESHVEVLPRLLKHEDFRVQKECLDSIYRIGGEHRGRILVSALITTEEDRLKTQIVDLLGATRYKKAVRPLTELLTSKSILKSKLKDQLEEKICIALGRIGSEEAIPTLESVSEQKRRLGIRAYSGKVKAAAGTALGLIEKKRSQSKDEGVSEEVSVEMGDGSEPSLTDVEDRIQKEVSKEEQLIEQYVAEDKKEEAIKLLYEMIVRQAKEKNFEKAEALRDRLYGVDPLALNEIIRANEAIEQEKSESIDQDHMKIWSSLYDLLNTEEANALYFALNDEAFDPNQTIYEQGEKKARLYFINKGEAKIVYDQGGREVLLKTIREGNLAGQEIFFTDTLCTVSLIALSHVELNSLDRGMLMKWREKFPLLQSKLETYCKGSENISELLKRKNLDRRSHRRFPLSGRVTAQIRDESGKTVGSPFRGGLLDISAGGLSFLIKLAKQETARLLLGRRLKTTLDFSGESVQPVPGQNGIVVGVRQRPFNEYSIHLKFDGILSETEMEEIKRFSSSNH
jgi:HEAT repeat protein/CRP-like cAMP-binding protein